MILKYRQVIFLLKQKYLKFYYKSIHDNDYDTVVILSYTMPVKLMKYRRNTLGNKHRNRCFTYQSDSVNLPGTTSLLTGGGGAD